ncbi:hypothetical protein [Kitasatospora viridis]|uniref:Uncharacterized protein n=1 Tax=Kitasatospora viridis TaxID=281105 RepID=A0A561T5Z8_9ACTN|nr:hypothetical protein [Kitasatospora viridis]TWF82528.1 hypothetical protein FHX73_1410 [Kitasatospora viridis]
MGGRQAQTWTVHTDVLPDDNGTRKHDHRLWWPPPPTSASPPTETSPPAQDAEVNQMIASITLGRADLPLDCADAITHLDQEHAGTQTNTPATADCTALVQTYLGGLEFPTSHAYPADRKACDVPVRS